MRLTQHFYRRLDAAGLIAERGADQVWSTGRPLRRDRLRTRHLPTSRYEAARGDRCDGCGALLDPPELLAPRSAIIRQAERPRGSRPARISSCANHCSSTGCAPLVDHRATAGLPWVTSLAHGWLTADLRDRCITRDLAWGVPDATPRLCGEGVSTSGSTPPSAYLAAKQSNGRSAEPARTGLAQLVVEAWRRPTTCNFSGKDNVPVPHGELSGDLAFGSGEALEDRSMSSRASIG